MMNVGNNGILGVLAIGLERKGHVSVRIVTNRGLEKIYLIQYKMIC